MMSRVVYKIRYVYLVIIKTQPHRKECIRLYVSIILITTKWLLPGSMNVDGTVFTARDTFVGLENLQLPPTRGGKCFYHSFHVINPMGRALLWRMCCSLGQIGQSASLGHICNYGRDLLLLDSKVSWVWDTNMSIQPGWKFNAISAPKIGQACGVRKLNIIIIKV